MQLSKRDLEDVLRSVGGVMFATGAVVLLLRKSAHHEWGDFARLLVVLVPAVVLYTLAVSVEPARGEAARPWQSVLTVLSILLGPVAIFQFLQWIGANTSHLLYDAGVFALTALLAGYAARRARVSYAVLLAGISVLLTWLLVWEKILGHPSANTDRWLLVAGAMVLFAGAGRLARASAIGAGELATAGGIAAVAAGVLGVIIGSFVGLTRGITKTLEGPSGLISRSAISSSPRISSTPPIFSKSQLSRHISSPATHVLPTSHVPSRSHLYSGLPQRLKHAHLVRPSHFTNPFLTHTSGLQHFGWDLYLLVVSLSLVWIGSRSRVRGLGYVGGVGLLAFLISIGEQVTRLESGHTPTTSIVGWPLALLIIGVVGLAVPALRRSDS